MSDPSRNSSSQQPCTNMWTLQTFPGDPPETFIAHAKTVATHFRTGEIPRGCVHTLDYVSRKIRRHSQTQSACVCWSQRYVPMRSSPMTSVDHILHALHVSPALLIT